MPELPDVELFKRTLERHGVGRTVARARVLSAKVLRGATRETFERALAGRRLERARRHGKHLFAALDDGRWLELHFGMTGSLAPVAGGAEAPKYTRARLDFTDGSALVYVNLRQLGHLALIDDADAFVAREGLGPDALDPELDCRSFAALLKARGRGAIKALLMDQALLAGIGNIYADEILFQAKIHPETKAAALDADAAARLYETMRAVLTAATRAGAGAEIATERLPADFIIPARKKGGRCPRCGTALTLVKTGGRTGYVCPTCQPSP